MMDSFLTLVGNLTGDPALGRTPAGTPVCRFRIAANERVFDRAAGRWRDGSVLYLPVICWRRLAENVAGSLRRGDPVAVVGRLRQWRGPQDGALQTEVATEIVAADLSRRVVRLLPVRPKDPDRELGRGSGLAPPPAAADGAVAPGPAAADGAVASAPAAADGAVASAPAADGVAGPPPAAESRPGGDGDAAGAGSRATAAKESAAA